MVERTTILDITTAITVLTDLIVSIQNSQVEVVELDVIQELIEEAPKDGAEIYSRGPHQTWTIVTKSGGA